MFWDHELKAILGEERALAQLAAPAGLVYATLLVAFAVMSVLANWYFQLPAAR